MARGTKQDRQAALRGQVVERYEDGRRVVEVYGGQLAFDGQVVELTTAFWPDRSTVSFRPADVLSIEWRDPGVVRNGRVQFVVPGASDRRKPGTYWTRTSKDERYRYTLNFDGEAQGRALRVLCDEIAAAMAS